MAYDNLDLGTNPLRWKAVFVSYLRGLYIVEGVHVRRAVGLSAGTNRDEHRQRVYYDTASALRWRARLKAYNELAYNSLLNGTVALALGALFLTPGFYVSWTTWWRSILEYVFDLLLGCVAGALAVVVFLVVAGVVAGCASLILAPGRRVSVGLAYREARQGTLALAVAMVAMVSTMFAASRMGNLPGPVHAGLVAGAWFGYMFAIFVLAIVLTSLVFSLLSRHFRRHHPDGQFVVGMAGYIDLLGDGQNRVDTWDKDKRYIRLRQLETVAAEFERNWPWWAQTRNYRADDAARRWGRQVASKVYETQLAILLGIGSTHEHRASVCSVLAEFLKGDCSAFDRELPPIPHHSAWWKRIGLLLVILLTVSIALAFLLVGLFQPDLPNLLTQWSWPPALVDKFRFGEGIQPPLLTVAAAFLGLTAKLAAPRGTSPDSPLAKKRGRHH